MLNDKEKLLIKKYYGPNKTTQTEIAKEFKTTQTAISRKIKCIVEKMRGLMGVEIAKGDKNGHNGKNR